MSAGHLAVARRLGLDATTALGRGGTSGTRCAGCSSSRGRFLSAGSIPTKDVSTETSTYSCPQRAFGAPKAYLPSSCFRMRFAGARAGELLPYERAWRRGSFDVDLHRSVWGPARRPRRFGLC